MQQRARQRAVQASTKVLPCATYLMQLHAAIHGELHRAHNTQQLHVWTIFWLISCMQIKRRKLLSEVKGTCHVETSVRLQQCCIDRGKALTPGHAYWQLLPAIKEFAQLHGRCIQAMLVTVPANFAAGDSGAEGTQKQQWNKRVDEGTMARRQEQREAYLSKPGMSHVLHNNAKSCEGSTSSWQHLAKLGGDQEAKFIPYFGRPHAWVFHPLCSRPLGSNCR